MAGMAAPMLSRGSAPPQLGIRQDIQGLRALAVIAVVAHHLLGWPAGGFVGVDVFFVISGYLITSLLLRESDVHGRISLSDFYRRRARRILPAATVCLVLVVAAALAIYRTARVDAIAGDAFFSMLFVANWHFAEVGTDYLSSAGPVSPLQHFWSLAVEEQFYLLWPVLLAIVLWLVCRPGRARGQSKRPVLAAVLVAGLAGSFGWAVVETANSPTWAYFSTLSRGWEIAAGALLAVVAAGRLSAFTSGVRSSMSIGGFALIVAALFVIGPETAIPGPWSAIPVVGALLVIAAGIGGRPRYSWALTNPGAGYVGRISYSLYLWHFPVIVMSAVLLPAGAMSTVATVLVVIAMAVASFHLVEEPVRRGAALGLNTGARQHRPWVATVGIAAVVASAIVVTTVAATTVATDTAHPATRASVEPEGVTSSDPAAQLTAELEVALHAEEWPELTPAIDGLSETGRPPKDRECAAGLSDPDYQNQPTTGPSTGSSADPTVVRGAAGECTFGDPDAAKLAVVVGDSIAITWIPLVQQVLASKGYRIQGLTMSGCPFVGTETRNPAANISAFCPRHKDAVVATIRSLRPDVVFVSNTYQPWLPGRPDVDIAANRFAQGQLSIIEEIATATDAIYVLAPPPPGRALEDCATTFSAPADCVSGVPDDWRSFNRAMSAQLAGAPRVTYIDTGSWFCTADGRCPSFVDHTPTRRDATGHVVPDYAQRLAPLLAQILAQPGS